MKMGRHFLEVIVVLALLCERQRALNRPERHGMRNKIPQNDLYL